MLEPQWITDKLPLLGLSISNGFMWRSKLVIIYAQITGRHIAELRANDNMQKQWWVLRESQEILAVEAVLGWMPLDVIPIMVNSLARPSPWLLDDHNQELLDVSYGEHHVQ